MKSTMLLAASISICAACSSSLKTPDATQVRADKEGYYAIHQLVLSNLRVRRPEGKSANPKASPGGEDFQSLPLPNEKQDCAPPSSLFRRMKLKEIRECLYGLQSEGVRSLRYELVRDDAPYLELSDADSLPACASEVLAKIPVARELVFQSPELGRDTETLDCFSARIDVEASRVLDIRLPIKQVELQVSLPLEPFPKNEEETGALLFSWSVSPFWTQQESRRALRSRLLPSPLCKRCIGADHLIRTSPNLPALWPNP